MMEKINSQISMDQLFFAGQRTSSMGDEYGAPITAGYHLPG